MDELAVTCIFGTEPATNFRRLNIDNFSRRFCSPRATLPFVPKTLQTATKKLTELYATPRIGGKPNFQPKFWECSFQNWGGPRAPDLWSPSLSQQPKPERLLNRVNPQTNSYGAGEAVITKGNGQISRISLNSLESLEMVGLSFGFSFVFHSLGVLKNLRH